MTTSKPRRPGFKSLLHATAGAAVALLVGTAHGQAAPVVKVAFSADYYPSTPQMLAQWMVQIAQGAAKKFDGLTVVAEPIHGGFDDFILSGHPHLEEAFWFGEHVRPRLQRMGLVAADPAPLARGEHRAVSAAR